MTYFHDHFRFLDTHADISAAVAATLGQKRTQAADIGPMPEPGAGNRTE
jgi:hypothetical protein